MAELVARGLRTEHVFEVLVGQHRGRNAGGDPHEVLQLLDARGHRHALRRREEAEQHIDLFLLDQPDRLVDRDIRLALGVGVDGFDLVALDAGLGVLVEHDLGADILQLRTAAGERAGQVVNHADLDFLFLGLGGDRHPQHRDCGRQPNEKACSFAPRHGILPGLFFVHCVFLVLVGAYHIGSATRCQACCFRPASQPGRRGTAKPYVRDGKRAAPRGSAVTKRGIAEVRSWMPRTRWMADNSG